jgi:hypothetical protein
MKVGIAGVPAGSPPAACWLTNYNQYLTRSLILYLPARWSAVGTPKPGDVDLQCRDL